MALNFVEKTSISLTGVDFSAVATADFDNDGDTDILITGSDSSSNPISQVYSNDGSGNLSHNTSISLTGVYRSAVATADFDNDGDTDILITGRDSSDNPISQVYSNDGSGNFSHNTSISLTGVDRSAVATADFDNDGDTDILITGWDSSGNYISQVYSNDGSGNLSHNTSISLTGVDFSAVATADFDNDGDTDILITGEDSSDNRISQVYSNDGSGNFSHNTSISLTGVYRGAVATADFDNDGDTDILITGRDSSGNSISQVYSNDGSGNFSQNTTISLRGVYDSAVATADFDNDGDTDILITGWDSSDNKISKVYTNDTDLTPPNVTTFTPADNETPFGVGANLVIKFNEAVGAGTGNIVIKRASDDSTVETIAVTDNQVSINGNTVRINPTSDLAELTEYYVEIDATAIQNTAGNDYAGINDKTTWNFTTGRIIPTLDFVENSSSLTGVRYSAVATADFDNDGDTDILITGLDSSNNFISQVYSNDGSGNFSHNTSISLTGVRYSAVATADFDNDGDTDILITGYDSSDNPISQVYSNDGSGNLSHNTSIPLTGVWLGAVATTDFDNDGDTDILITGRNSSDNRISQVYSNDGSGNFSHNTSISLTGVEWSAVATADFDNDGDTDILITGLDSSNNFISQVYSNDGSGNFSHNTSISLTGVRYSAVATADFDNDGDTDILITGYDSSDNPISQVYSNDGSGNLSHNTSIPLTGVWLGAVATTDFDNDGDTDILITGRNSSDNRISQVYSNDGSGNFSHNTSISLTGVEWSAVATADFDNDGSTDILITGLDSSGNPISQVYNNTPLDSTPPTVTTFTPADNETPVGVGANLVIKFNEAVVAGTGNIVIKRASDDSTVETIAVTDNQISINGNTVRINPTSDLAELTEYYVEIDATAIQDTAGNNYAGITDKTTWNFTTGRIIPTLDFVENSSSLTGVDYSAVATADFDNDGDTDILITGSDSSSNPISQVYSNDGSGNLSHNTSISLTGVFYSAVATADFDNDGDTDILITGQDSSGSPISQVYSNDGSGNLSHNTSISLTGVFYSAVATADFDNDGDTDILITGYDSSGNRISQVYSNDGSGNLSHNTSISLTGVLFGAVATADFDNDGDTDILITGRDSSDNRISQVYSNDGSGNLSHNTSISLTGVAASAVATADFDNNGDTDILITGRDSSGNRISQVYSNDGSGNLSHNTSISLTGVERGAVATADFDNDGDTDILITGRDSSSFQPISQVYSNDGSGNFSQNTTISLRGVYDSAVATADFDNDGAIDILITGWDSSSNKISKVYNNTPLDSTAPTVTTFTPSDDATLVQVGANLVINFDEDVVAGSGNITLKKVSDNSEVTTTVTIDGNTVTINPDSDLEESVEYYVEIDPGAIEDTAGNDYAGISGNSSWNFTTITTTYGPNWNLETIADFSQDGVPDILWRNGSKGGNSIQLMNNDGTTNTIVNPGSIGPNWNQETIADFNQDGVPDILWRNGNTGANSIWLMENDGTLNSDVDPGSIGPNWHLETVADFNQDEIPDIIWRNDSTGANSIWLMKNDGTLNSDVDPGSLAPNWNLETVADFNQDEILDIIWRNDTTGANRIWLMENDGTLNSDVNPGNIDPNWSLETVADFNQDQVPDIIWRNGSTGGNRIWLMENDGTLDSAVNPGDVGPNWNLETVADFNQDQVPDIIWRNGSKGGNRIWLMENDATLDSDVNPGAVGPNWNLEAVTDLTQDGIPDIFWRNGGTGANRIWLMDNNGIPDSVV